MHWNWKQSLFRNSLKTGSHILIEASVIGAWYIALEGDPVFWLYGILSAFAIHVGMFNIVDFFHDHHTHNKNGKIPVYISDPKVTISDECRGKRHFSCKSGRGCCCICHKREA